jgi:hypothetical protein
MKHEEALSSLVSRVKPTAGCLDVALLEELVAAIADRADLWRPLVRHQRDRRFYEQLYREPSLDIWLICWDAFQETGLHDHDRSAGSVRVVEGTLLEDFFASSDDGSIALRTVAHPAGSAFSFDSSYIHDVRHDGRQPAVSLHAYSPALWRMGYYELGARGLGRVSLTYVDEVAA